MDSLVFKEECFDLYAALNAKPVGFLKGVSNVICGAGVRAHTGGRALDLLQFVQDFRGCAIEGAVALIKR